MGRSWTDFAPLIAPAITAAVDIVERMCGAGGGSDKRRSAIEIAGEQLRALRDPYVAAAVGDPELVRAIGAMVDAYVQVQNVIAKHSPPGSLAR
jgi:hypothetical protein